VEVYFNIRTPRGILIKVKLGVVATQQVLKVPQKSGGDVWYYFSHFS
jgi:hypothetical protein